MARQHDLDAHFGSALHYRVEVIHLEPEQHTITVGPVGAIADGAVMMFGFKAVQLQEEPAILHQLLILPAAVSPAAAQQPLIPPAAGFDIRDTDERLRAHGFYGSRTAHVKQVGSVCDGLQKVERRCTAEPLATFSDGRDRGDEFGDVALDLIRWEIVAGAGVRLAEIAADHERAQPRLGKAFRLRDGEPADDLHGRGAADSIEDGAGHVIEQWLSMSVGSARRASACR